MKKLYSISIITLLLIQLLSNSTSFAKNEDKLLIRVNLWSNELIVMKNKRVIKRYSIAPGKAQSPTPIGIYKIKEKSKGWGGGFGSRWIGLNVPWGEFGIHGTNRPGLIGKSVSSGCIRMLNKDVEDLYKIVPKGTIVQIVGPVTGIGEGELKNLSFGSKGTLVLLIQNRLKAMGIYHGPIDGRYDLGTEIAVKEFQKINHIPITGGISKREYIILGVLE